MVKFGVVILLACAAACVRCESLPVSQTDAETEQTLARDRRGCCDRRCQFLGLDDGKGCCITACCRDKIGNATLHKVCEDYFIVSDNTMNWASARDFCTGHGVEMVDDTLCLTALQERVLWLLSLGKTGGYWTCYRNLPDTSRAIYPCANNGIDRVDAPHWGPGYPINFLINNCVSTYYDLLQSYWVDLPCTELRYAVCWVPDTCFAPCQC